MDQAAGGRTKPEEEQQLEDCESAVGVAPHNGGPDPAFNEWECEFLESVREQVDDGRELTERQRGVLRKLWERI